MNEKELKDNINALRHEIDQREKKVKELYRQINFHKKDADMWRSKRDEITEKANKLSEEAKVFTANRDELNEKISLLKEKRSNLINTIKNITKDIKQNKSARDELNKAARGTDEYLLNMYVSDLEILLNRDIPLGDEVRIFDKIFELTERVDVAKQADYIHKKIIGGYDHVQTLKTNLDTIHEEIQSIARASQEQHEEAMRIYKEVSGLRKESDECHKKLLEKYDEMNPLRDKVNEVKTEVKGLQEKLSPHLEDMEKIRNEREERRRDKDLTEAREKLQTNKRLSIEDFRLLLEKGEIALEKTQDNDSQEEKQDT
ncbi:MAG: hypothetical protein JW724_02345 [Candidatus Altiarchaeota archaeon]|nr:hypothetical protein [Candidatus Altiarchaeota archaeon]